MIDTFEPKLDILPLAQRKLWEELVDVPAEFTLCGGTAVALHLGHRESVDFDFFGTKEFSPVEFAEQIPFLRDATITQSEPNTISAVVDRGGPIKVSFFGLTKISLLKEPHVTKDIHLKVASLLDLSGMKAAVVQKRAEKKDYLDIDAILTSGQINLPEALAAAKAIYGGNFNPESTLKALCYFGDGNVGSLPVDVKQRLVKAATQVDLDEMPVLDSLSKGNGGAKP